jgi:hypothetical protein
MTEDETWRFVAALHNTGANSNSYVFGTPDSINADFWSRTREFVQGDFELYENGSMVTSSQKLKCTNPTSWDCLSTAIIWYIPLPGDTETGLGGYCTVEYANSVAPDGISTNPTSSEILNQPVKACEK